jgi:hypothetical protein
MNKAADGRWSPNPGGACQNMTKASARIGTEAARILQRCWAITLPSVLSRWGVCRVRFKVAPDDRTDVGFAK